MSLHQQDQNMLPDSEFLPGGLKFLKEGNSCRLLDLRRTPGVVESVNSDSGMFRWRISKFEDRGKFWDVPIENSVRFQFSKISTSLSDADIQNLSAMVRKYNEPLVIECNQDAAIQTNKVISEKFYEATSWLKNHSKFFSKNLKLNFNSTVGPNDLRQDLTAYMDSKQLLEQERLTSETYVLNPSSGEWIKGMQIVLAENGMRPFFGTIPRTTDIFVGAGSKETRLKYIATRMGFIKAFFNFLNIDSVVLFRGMTTESEWSTKNDKTFSSWTFSKKVGESFASVGKEELHANSYFLKRTMSVDKLFTTYLETEAMNNQYDEAEAVLLHSEEDQKLW